MSGVLFDLTDAANAPTVGGACAAATSSPATGFALMQHSLCDGVFYRWFGNQDAGSSTFAFYNETLALPAHTGANASTTGPGGDSPFPLFASGDWTLIGTTPPVPEPSTTGLMLIGAALLAHRAARMRGVTRSALERAASSTRRAVLA